MKLQAVALVEESLETAVLEMERAIVLFYGRLFALDPSLCALFPDDLNEHGRLFLEMLRRVVSNLYAPETVIPMVKEIGRVHVRHGVQPRHYQLFGEAFLWMLGELHGAAFTEELAQSWWEVYYLVAGLMKEGEGR
jgi:nitric oxide dioxygenase